MGGLRRELKKLRAKVEGAPQSFLLTDGSRYERNPDTHGIERFMDTMEKAGCDYEQRPRPPAHPLYPALCRAVNRRNAVIRHFPTYGTGARTGMCPYDLTMIIREGRLQPTSLVQGFEVVEAEPPDAPPEPGEVS